MLFGALLAVSNKFSFFLKMLRGKTIMEYDDGIRRKRERKKRKSEVWIFRDATEKNFTQVQCDGDDITLKLECKCSNVLEYILFSVLATSLLINDSGE